MSIVDVVARAICAETCAFKGEPACYQVRDDQDRPMPWPNPNCDEPGCVSLAAAAIHAYLGTSASRAKER